MNIKFFHSAVFAFTAIVASVVLGGGCAAQTAGTQIRAQGAEGAQVAANAALLDPKLANREAPPKFRVKFTTTKGDVVVEVTRAWAPNGADRFYNLCQIGYYKDIAIFRSIEGFMFQFGIHGNPKVSAKWMEATIQDDPSVGISNTQYTLSFAQTGRPNTRGVQTFINMGNNGFLDKARGGGAPFVPFGVIVEGKDVVKKIHVTGENDREVQGNFQQSGNVYIQKKYPNLDYIRSVEVSVVN